MKDNTIQFQSFCLVHGVPHYLDELGVLYKGSNIDWIHLSIIISLKLLIANDSWFTGEYRPSLPLSNLKCTFYYKPSLWIDQPFISY